MFQFTKFIIHCAESSIENQTLTDNLETELKTKTNDVIHFLKLLKCFVAFIAIAKLKIIVNKLNVYVFFET